MTVVWPKGCSQMSRSGNAVLYFPSSHILGNSKRVRRFEVLSSPKLELLKLDLNLPIYHIGEFLSHCDSTEIIEFLLNHSTRPRRPFQVRTCLGGFLMDVSMILRGSRITMKLPLILQGKSKNQGKGNRCHWGSLQRFTDSHCWSGLFWPFYSLSPVFAGVYECHYTRPVSCPACP